MSTNYLILFCSRDRAKFPFFCVWAGLRDSFLTHRILQKQWYVTLETRSQRAWRLSFLSALSLSPSLPLLLPPFLPSPTSFLSFWHLLLWCKPADVSWEYPNSSMGRCIWQGTDTSYQHPCACTYKWILYTQSNLQMTSALSKSLMSILRVTLNKNDPAESLLNLRPTENVK